jgi:hypothetical protein
MSMTSEQRPERRKISTRVECVALATIERVAAAHRTTPAQVARVLIEDGARALAAEQNAGAGGMTIVAGRIERRAAGA